MKIICTKNNHKKLSCSWWLWWSEHLVCKNVAKKSELIKSRIILYTYVLFLVGRPIWNLHPELSYCCRSDNLVTFKIIRCYHLVVKTAIRIFFFPLLSFFFYYYRPLRLLLAIFWHEITWFSWWCSYFYFIWFFNSTST